MSHLTQRRRKNTQESQTNRRADTDIPRDRQTETRRQVLFSIIFVRLHIASFSSFQNVSLFVSPFPSRFFYSSSSFLQVLFLTFCLLVISSTSFLFPLFVFILSLFLPSSSFLSPYLPIHLPPPPLPSPST